VKLWTPSLQADFGACKDWAILNSLHWTFQFCQTLNLLCTCWSVECWQSWIYLLFHFSMLVQTQWSSISLSAAEITVFWFVCSHLPYWSFSPSRPPKFFCAVQHSGYEGGCTTQLLPTSSTTAAGNDGAAWCVTPP